MNEIRLSVSGLNMLCRCGEQFRFRYIDGVKAPPGWSLIVGSGTDESVNQDLLNKINTGVLLPDEAIADVARDAVVRRWDEEEVKLDDDLAEMGQAAARAYAIDTAVLCASLHHREAAPKIAPTHVQRYWRLEVTGTPIVLSGVIDVQEGSRAIRDTKTSKKSPSPGEADNNLQLTTYALAVRQIDGAAPEKVCLDYCVHTKAPKLVQLESKREDADYEHLLQRIWAAQQAIEKGAFMPAPLDAWYCSARFCGYWDRCRYARRPLTIGVARGINGNCN